MMLFLVVMPAPRISWAVKFPQVKPVIYFCKKIKKKKLQIVGGIKKLP